MGKNDPLSPGKKAANLGSAALDRGGDPRWELGEVLSFDVATHTAVVRTHRGRPLRDVPVLRKGPGDFEHYDAGVTVSISYDLGFPVIVGCIDFVGPAQGTVTPVDVTGTDNDNPLVPSHGSSNYKPPYAPDMRQGDWVRVGTLGNHVAVLEGGVSSLGSPTALIRSLGLAGVLQLISRTSQTVNDFGQWHVENDQGRTSFVLRAGSSQTTQTGADEEHWTIRLDVGATGDLFDFKITQPDGHTVFRLHVTGDGRVQFYGDGGVDISSGPNADAATISDIAGARAADISSDDTLTVAGNRTTRIGKADQTTVGADKATVIGASETRFVNNDLTLSAGGKKTEVVVGGIDTKVVNGGWSVDINNPKDGATPSTDAGFHLKTALGDIVEESGGGMSLHSKKAMELEAPNITLGAHARHPLPKFDDFQGALGTFLTQLLAVLNAGTSGGPLTALPAALPQLQQFIQRVQLKTPFQSNKVKNE